MARKESHLKIVIQPAARRDLLAIWDYNAETYGAEHADRYLGFLSTQTARLSVHYDEGKPIPGRPEYQFITFRKGKGHGHVAIYRVTSEAVEVLRYQHTAQDWQGKATRGDI